MAKCYPVEIFKINKTAISLLDFKRCVIFMGFSCAMSRIIFLVPHGTIFFARYSQRLVIGREKIQTNKYRKASENGHAILNAISASDHHEIGVR